MRALFTLFMIVPLSLLRGLVVRDVWSWFVVPLGLPALGLAHAIGISLTVGMLTHQIVTSPMDELEGWTKTISQAAAVLVTNLVVWGMGAIVASFM